MIPSKGQSTRASAAAAVAMTLWAAPAAAQGLTLLDAIRTSLDKSPELLIQKASVAASRGVARSAEGQFDILLDASAGHSHLETEVGPDVSLKEDLTSFEIGASKTFGWGMNIRPSFQMVYSNRRVATLSLSAGPDPLFVGQAQLTLTQPLLRDFGSATTANLDATQIAYRAEVHRLKHALQTQVFITAAAYWNYAAASESTKVLTIAEKRAQALLEETKALVKADERPKSDLDQLEANLSNQTRARIDAEQALDNARIELGLAMGLEADAIDALAPASTEFPKASAQAANMESLLAVALASRQDLKAAGQTVSAARRRLDGAENATLPRLDLVGDVGVSGIGESVPFDQFFELGSPIPKGFNATLSLVFSWAPQNNALKGAQAAAIAAKRQAEVSERNLQRTISARVRLASRELRRRSISLNQAKRAAALQIQAVNNDRKRLKAGLATLLDVILTETRLTAARLNQISSERLYAQSILQIRRECGRITSFSKGGATVDLADVTTAVSN